MAAENVKDTVVTQEEGELMFAKAEKVYVISKSKAATITEPVPHDKTEREAYIKRHADVFKTRETNVEIVRVKPGAT